MFQDVTFLYGLAIVYFHYNAYKWYVRTLLLGTENVSLGKRISFSSEKKMFSWKKKIFSLKKKIYSWKKNFFLFTTYSPVWHFTKTKSKGKCLYSAVSSSQDCSKHFTVYFPSGQTCSLTDTISASLGGIQPYAAIKARRLLIHISTTVYSQVLIYIAE